MIKDYFFLGLKNLKRRGIRSWLTLLGIFIGIAAVVSLITLGNGLQAAVTSQFGIASTQVLTVEAGGLSFGAPGSGAVNPLTVDDAEEIEKISSVEFALPRNIAGVKVKFNDITNIQMAVSIPDDRIEETIELVDIKAEYGRMIKESDSNRINVGNDYSDKEKSGFEKAVEVSDKVEIQGKEFKVVGILEKKGSFIIDRTIFMKDSELEELQGYGDDVDLIDVKVKSKDLVDKAKEDIEDLLRKRRDVDKGEEDFTVTTPEAQLQRRDRRVFR